MMRIFHKILIFTLIFLPFGFSSAEIALPQAPAPIRILLVPGHDDEVWGAQYGHVKEAKMNLAVAKRIHNILKKDKRFEVWVTRDDEGYTKEFADYLSIQRESIVSFRDNAKEVLVNLIENGFFVEKDVVPHNNASEDASVVLYGINKWANENKMDAVIHIHFNDYPRPNKWTIGKHTGFAVYTPEGQMANSPGSGQLAASIFWELKKKYSTSTYEKEMGGLVAEQKLIALGSNNTLLESVRSVLIEYGYIYEKKFRNYTTRHRAYDDMAKLTATGIKEYFFSK